jgi:hypothetical protein
MAKKIFDMGRNLPNELDKWGWSNMANSSPLEDFREFTNRFLEIFNRGLVVAIPPGLVYGRIDDGSCIDPVDGARIPLDAINAIEVDSLCPIETALRNLGNERLAIYGDMIDEGREDSPIPCVRASYRRAVAMAVLRVRRALFSLIDALLERGRERGYTSPPRYSNEVDSVCRDKISLVLNGKHFVTSDNRESSEHIIEDQRKHIATAILKDLEALERIQKYLR